MENSDLVWNDEIDDYENNSSSESEFNSSSDDNSDSVHSDGSANSEEAKFIEERYQQLFGNQEYDQEENTLLALYE